KERQGRSRERPQDRCGEENRRNERDRLPVPASPLLPPDPPSPFLLPVELLLDPAKLLIGNVVGLVIRSHVTPFLGTNGFRSMTPRVGLFLILPSGDDWKSMRLSAG